MSVTESTRAEVVGEGITTIDAPPNAVFKVYATNRPAPTPEINVAENVIDVSITLPYSVDRIWPIFQDFNLWMNRFGYFWDQVPAVSEGSIVSLTNKPGSNDYKYGKKGPPARYIVRKVIPKHLIYFDALPKQLPDIDGKWNGRTVVSLRQESERTRIEFFMEHTYYSRTASREALLAEAKGCLPSIVAFWRDYFVHDLTEAVESRLRSSAKDVK
jgi:hypothetical protein